MKHLTTARYEEIEKAADAMAKLQNGSRKQYEEKEKIIIDTAGKMAKECKNLPKNYAILYTFRQNLGTNNYSYMVTASAIIGVFAEDEIKETVASIIIGNKRISKDKIICYIY